MSQDEIAWLSATCAIAFLGSQHARLGETCSPWLREFSLDILKIVLEDVQMVALKGHRLREVRLDWRIDPLPCYSLWTHISERARLLHVKQQLFFMRHFFENGKRFWLKDARQSKRSEMVLYETVTSDLLDFENVSYLRGALDGILMLNYNHQCQNIRVREIYSEERNSMIIQVFVFGEDFMSNIQSLDSKSRALARKGDSGKALEHYARCPFHKIGSGSMWSLQGMGSYMCKCPKIWELVMSSECFKKRMVLIKQGKKKTKEKSLSFISTDQYKKIEFEIF